MFYHCIFIIVLIFGNVSPQEEGFFKKRKKDIWAHIKVGEKGLVERGVE